MLTRTQAAALAGVAVTTWDAYVSRGQAPQPDRRLMGRPLWHEATVTAWLAQRPGRGRWGARTNDESRPAP